MTAPNPTGGPEDRPATPHRGPYSERVERFERARGTARSHVATRLESARAVLRRVRHRAARRRRSAINRRAAWPIAGAAAVAFVGFVLWHSRVIAAEDDALRMARVNLDARARVTGTWSTLPDDGARFASDAHPYSSDLDLFGPGSLLSTSQRRPHPFRSTGARAIPDGSSGAEDDTAPSGGGARARSASRRATDFWKLWPSQWSNRRRARRRVARRQTKARGAPGPRASPPVGGRQAVALVTTRISSPRTSSRS